MKRSVTVGVVGTLALLAAGPAPAAGRAQHYLLALSWQPEFCQSHRRVAECRDESAGRYDGKNLVLHGLWPQPRNNEYCGVPAVDRQRDQTHRWQDLPPVTLSQGLRAEVMTLMPGARSQLDRHEWIRHGTCSGMTQEDYFQTMVDLAKAAARTATNKLIASRVGGSITVDELCTAVIKDFGPSYQQAIRVQRIGGNLSEIGISLAARPDGSVVLAPSQLERAGGANLRCDSGRAPDNRKLSIDPPGP